MNKKILIASLVTLASVAGVVGTVGNAHKVEAANTDNSNEKWSAIGTINGTSWNTDFPLAYDSTDDRYELEIALTANQEFKIRLNNAWTTSIGYGGNTGAGISSYLLNSGGNFKVKTTGNYILWVKDDNVRNYGDKSYGFGIDKAAEAVYHTVTHHSKDGSVLKTEEVLENSTYNPAFEEVEGYRLEGWYTNSELTTKLEKGTAIKTDYNLYPRYVEAEDYIVYFEDVDATFGEKVNVYMYSDSFDGHYNAGWPGTAIEKDVNKGWVVDVDASKSFDKIIFNDGKLQTINLDLSSANNGDTFVLSSSKDSEGHYEATLKKTGVGYEVKDLLTKYYNEGTYTRNTVINLNEGAKNELAKYWHDGSKLLERTTYFKGEELWMTHHESGYSYYGTSGSNTVYARTNTELVTPENTYVAIKGKTMEQYYTTLADIKDNTAEWTKTGNVYSTNDPTVVKMFLDFTAPCLYDVTEENNNYLSYNGVEVEETSEGLVLRLKATTLETGKLAVENGVLSTATITK